MLAELRLVHITSSARRQGLYPSFWNMERILLAIGYWFIRNTRCIKKRKRVTITRICIIAIKHPPSITIIGRGIVKTSFIQLVTIMSTIRRAVVAGNIG